MNEEKESNGEKKPKSFRTFMVRDMREEKYQEFRRFCDAQGMDFAETILLLMTHFNNSTAYDLLHQRIEALENTLNQKKEEKKKIVTMGGE